MMKRWTVIGVIPALAVPCIFAQSPGQQAVGSSDQARYEEDVSWPATSSRKLTGYQVDAFGERVKYEVVRPPSSALKLADEINALTPQEGLARLEAIAKLERVLTDDMGPEERAAELDLLATLTEEIDLDDRTFARAFRNYARALDPLFTQISRETHSRLVCGAVDYGLSIMNAHDPFQSRLSGAPCEWSRSRGKAWINQMAEGLNNIEHFEWTDRKSLLSLSCCGMLTSADLNRLLRAATPCLTALTQPGNPREQDRLNYLGDNLLSIIAGLPELDREDARTLLSLLCGMKNSGVEFASHFCDARWLLMYRFNPRDLYPDGIPSTIENCMAEDMKRGFNSSKLEPPRHARVSTWRFAPGADPECLATESFEATPGIWTIRTWGEPTPLGAIAVRPELKITYWESLATGAQASIYNQWDGAGSIDGNKVKAGTASYILEQCLCLPVADGWRERFGRATIYTSVIEFDQTALENPLDPTRLYHILTDGLGKDYRFRAAALGYLKSRPEPSVRELLKMLCQRRGDEEIRAQVARVLLERRDWAALDEMLPSLLKRPPWQFPPLLDVFEEAAKPDVAPKEIRLNWAKAIIRTQITPPMHPDNIQILLTLCGQLGAPNYQYRASDDETQRAEALQRARAWAD